ncbi:unnamed protein product, partial [Lymnaea stagnalis]
MITQTDCADDLMSDEDALSTTQSSDEELIVTDVVALPHSPDKLGTARKHGQRDGVGEITDFSKQYAGSVETVKRSDLYRAGYTEDPQSGIDKPMFNMVVSHTRFVDSSTVQQEISPSQFNQETPFGSRGRQTLVLDVHRRLMDASGQPGDRSDDEMRITDIITLPTMKTATLAELESDKSPSITEINSSDKLNISVTDVNDSVGRNIKQKKMSSRETDNVTR